LSKGEGILFLRMEFEEDSIRIYVVEWFANDKNGLIFVVDLNHHLHRHGSFREGIGLHLSLQRHFIIPSI
jgi:hypothetical protein